MRKAISLLTAMALLCLLAIPAGAQTEVRVRGNTVVANAGDTVEFAVFITDNPGISAFQICLEFDKEVLRPVRTADGSILVNAGAETRTGMFISRETETGCQIMWGSGQNASGDGVLFSVLFEADAYAEGTYPVKVTCVPEDTANAAGQPVALACADGAVTLCAVPVISLGTAAGLPGDSVTVPVFLEKNPGFATVVLTFGYDTARLKLTAIKKGALLSSSSGGFSRNVNDGRVMWYDSVDTRGDGVLFELIFTILEGDGYEEIPVSAALTDGNARNFGGTENPDQPVAFASGAVVRRSGQLLVEDVHADDTFVTVMLQDAPAEPVTVVLAASEGGKMKTATMKTLVLEVGENVFSYSGGGNSVKVFFLTPDSWVPLCAAVERNV